MADVLFKRGTKAEIDAEPISDGKILFTTDQTYNKIYTDNGTNRIQIGGTMDVDTTLSTTSTNPIANNVVSTEINKINTGFTDKTTAKLFAGDSINNGFYRIGQLVFFFIRGKTVPGTYSDYLKINFPIIELAFPCIVVGDSDSPYFIQINTGGQIRIITNSYGTSAEKSNVYCSGMYITTNV